VDADRHQSVREQDVPKRHEGDAEQAVDAAAVETVGNL
jgi:hypothetical protein